MQSKSILIYGAYGFTGRLIVEQAVKVGLHPVLSGRDAEKVKAVAEEFRLPWEAFSLEETDKLDSMLRGIDIVMNAAGPYSKSAKPMVEACLRQQSHYLDITGEISVFEWIATQNAAAEEAGISLIPGCGFDVVPTDCLAAFLHEKMPDAEYLELAFKGSGSLSRGTALTVAENLHQGGLIRENGELKPVPSAWRVKQIDFGKGSRLCMSIPWGDVSTAFYTTGIPNISVYTAVAKSAIRFAKLSNRLGWFLQLSWVKKKIEAYIRKNIVGPDKELRKTGVSYVIGTVSNAKSEKITARLTTPEAYQLTAITAVKAIQKLQKGIPACGFLTPALAFGADFIMEIKGTTREILGSE
jgi:short subunit dehydrogenase-like uncharacterized protein